MTLDTVIKNIVFNDGIHGLLTDVLRDEPLREHPYKKLVEFQRGAYAEAGLDIKTEGFQIGEPWNGDISNARVAFISSNPSFNPNENFPRYHAETKTVSMPNGEKLDLNGITKFFTDRFKNAVVTSSKALQIECNSSADGNYYHTVPYWGCARNSVEALWPNAAKKGDTPETYVKRLMSRAVCMEVVQFKSRRETGVNEALSYCLRNFTRHILPDIAAPIIVLVGKNVRSAFLGFFITDENEWGKASQAFDNGEAYLYGGKWVVSTGFNSGIFSLANSCSETAIKKLQKIFGDGLN